MARGGATRSRGRRKAAAAVVSPQVPAATSPDTPAAAPAPVAPVPTAAPAPVALAPDAGAVLAARGGRVFQPYRALGYVATDVPAVVQTRGGVHFVTTCIGRSFHIYDVRRRWLHVHSERPPPYVRTHSLRGSLVRQAGLVVRGPADARADRRPRCAGRLDLCRRRPRRSLVQPGQAGASRGPYTSLLAPHPSMHSLGTARRRL
jgi:hypothetical protein